ncbi:MAG: S8 family serine peptidase, partial [Myxococcota bacterium]
ALALACGDDDDPQSDDLTDTGSGLLPTPLNPVFGSNNDAYGAIGTGDLMASGLSGAGVDVCIVDTGLDANHPGFAHVFARGGVRFRDFTAEASGSPIDTNGHGTHVAGIVAMYGELSGGAPNVNLLIARVFTADGGADVITIANAVDWCRTEGADIISMSLGGLALPGIEELLQQDPSASEAAVQNALDAGIYVVAAAGNTELARDVATPAGVDGVIAVGALDSDLETKASFSQSGVNDGGVVLDSRQDPDRKPELSAPGVSIVSAMASGSSLAGDVEGCASVDYCALNGTSQATPFVTAILALVLEAEPELKPETQNGVAALKTVLSQNATLLPGQSEPHDDGVGYGRVSGIQILEALQ